MWLCLAGLRLSFVCSGPRHKRSGGCQPVVITALEARSHAADSVLRRAQSLPRVYEIRSQGIFRDSMRVKHELTLLEGAALLNRWIAFKGHKKSNNAVKGFLKAAFLEWAHLNEVGADHWQKAL